MVQVKSCVSRESLSERIVPKVQLFKKKLLKGRKMAGQDKRTQLSLRLLALKLTKNNS